MALNYAFATALVLQQQERDETRQAYGTAIEQVSCSGTCVLWSWLEPRETVKTAVRATVKGAEILILGLHNSIHE
jgi:hypothetical protein